MINAEGFNRVVITSASRDVIFSWLSTNHCTRCKASAATACESHTSHSIHHTPVNIQRHLQMPALLFPFLFFLLQQHHCFLLLLLLLLPCIGIEPRPLFFYFPLCSPGLTFDTSNRLRSETNMVIVINIMNNNNNNDNDSNFTWPYPALIEGQAAAPSFVCALHQTPPAIQ